MNASLPPSALLRAHLSPDMVTYLEHHDDLPPAVRADLAIVLRRTLVAYAAYIPERIVHAHLSDPSPGRVQGDFWDGSLLFADLSGFTRLSEHLSVLGKQGAEEISAVINRLFDELVAEVRAHRGTLLKFGGDALTAFFDAEVLDSIHAAAAVSAALAMQERMQAFVAVATRAGTFRLQLRVGVHSGRVFAAEVGDAEHIELVVTGAEVNRVALAQEIAAPGEVVGSNRTVALLQTQGYVSPPGIRPRANGYQQILQRPHLPLVASPTFTPIPDSLDDLATLTRLASQVAALRPYLVRHLPGRFLTSLATEPGEFRPVSVLFVNFADFSTLLDRLADDVETATSLLNLYFRNAQAAVHRYNGIINKVDMATHGDKLMALFGAPVAYEDDPLCAVHCALELRDSLAQVNAAIRDRIQRIAPDKTQSAGNDSACMLTQRIGINSGTVFAGRVGGLQRYEYTVMGPEVNLAARLMAAAEANSILLSPTTRAAVAHQIAIEDYGPLTLKGLAGPVTAGLARHIAETGRSVVSAAGLGLRQSSLVGRDQELAHLFAQADVALRGAGRVLALVGEAGTGKTRLSQELLQRLVLDSGHNGVPPFLIFSGDCQSYDRHTPYMVLRRALAHILGMGAQSNRADASAPVDVSSVLQMRVEQLAPDLARFIPLLGDVIGIDLPETPLTRSLSAEQRHDRLQEFVVALFIGLARRDPLLLLFDDLQWADVSSRELLGHLAHAITSVPCVLLLNYRPDPPISEPWIDQATTTRLELRELPMQSCEDLLAGMLNQPPPPALRPLLERTQGNPFFIEELVYALASTGTLARDPSGQWHITRAIDPNTVPDSIEKLLRARIDRLDEARYELLQVASVVGRRFAHPVVAGVYRHTAPLDEGLRHLIELEIIQAEQQEDELNYLFRHTLLRDVAYEAILYAHRRDLHQRVASRVEELSQGQRDEHLALLAYHYLHAEAWLPAFRYHLAAGIQAQRRFANHDALALLTTALQLLPRLTTDERAALASDVVTLYEHIGGIHELSGEYTQALTAYTTALADLSAMDVPADAMRVRLYRLLAVVQERQSDYVAAFNWLEQGMACATSEARAELARCYLLGAGMYRRQGEYQRSLEWVHIGLGLAERIDSQHDQATALKLLGGTCLAMGDNARALEYTSRALHLFEAVQDLVGLADAHNDLAITYQVLGRLPEAHQHFEVGAQIKADIGDVFGQAMIANNLGELLRMLDDLDGALQQYQHSLAIFERLGSRYAVGVLHMNIGSTYMWKDDLEQAEAHLRQSGNLFEQSGTDEFLPELQRCYAELYLRRGDFAAAHAACITALETAMRLQTRLEEGISRRLLGQIYARERNLVMAWEQFVQSRSLLEQGDNPHELARTLLLIAGFAPRLQHFAEGQAAFDQAIPILQRIGARHDLAAAEAVAMRHGYISSLGS